MRDAAALSIGAGRLALQTPQQGSAHAKSSAVALSRVGRPQFDHDFEQEQFRRSRRYGATEPR